MSENELTQRAIEHALKALRKRHFLEEGAHAPAFIALANLIAHHLGSEWKENDENLEVELQQCYKAQSRVSEKLVVEVVESRSLKGLLTEKEPVIIADQQNKQSRKRDECSRLKADLEKKIEALELVLSEKNEIRAQLARENVC